VVIVLAELGYLVVANTALQLSVTQTLVNLVKPETFHVSWERAWTWYPFRVHAQGIAANGQSRTQQWQLRAPLASGSISLLPLLLKRVWIRDVVAADIDYRQRPRLKPGEHYSRRLRFFPEIEGREVAPIETRPLSSRRPWHIAVNDIRATGEHSVWIYEARAQVSGHARGDLGYQTRGGPFSLNVAALDLLVDRLFLDGDQEVFRCGSFRGELGFAPFIPRENKNIGLLSYLTLNLDISVDVEDLSFLNLFTLDFQSLTVNGSGKIDGRLNFDLGTVLDGTDLVVDADELRVQLLDHRIEGEGRVTLELDQAAGQDLDLVFEYRDLAVFQSEAAAPVLAGHDLKLLLTGNGYVLPDRNSQHQRGQISAVVAGLSAPDLTLFQRYLPTAWPLQLRGGGGRMEGSATLSPTALSIDLLLNSDKADVALNKYRFTTNLEVALKLENPAYLVSSTSVAGSYVKIGDATLYETGSRAGRRWDAQLRFDRGEFSLLDASVKQQREDLADLVQVLRGTRLSELMAQSTGVLHFDAEVSRLDWLEMFLRSDLVTAIDGSGLLDGELYLTAGLPDVGTDVRVRSEDLAIDVLDYTGSGMGDIRLRVKEGGNQGDWEFDVKLEGAGLGRQGDQETVAEDVSLRLNAVVEDVRLSAVPYSYALRFNIDSASVPDMSVFNDFLPPDAPVRFSGGTADLAADILLHPDNASGWVRLNATDLTAWAGGQTVRADLRTDIRLAGGRPADMIFDIAGSALTLSKVAVSGDNERFTGDYWSAQFDLPTARIRWRNPLEMTARAELALSDTRPFVAMFDNQGWRPQFLSQMLTVEGIEGDASMEASGGVFNFSEVNVTGDHLEVGARGTIGQTDREGVVYIRYRKADALLKMKGGDKNVDIFGARKKYEAYRVPPLPRPPSPAGNR
jgi:hypothetical protein